MLYKSLPNLIVHSLKTGRPNPFIDIPDLLNPSVSSEGYTANITPEQYQHRIQLTEHEARKKLIKSGDLPPDNTTEVAGASEGTSGDAQGEGGNGENGGTDASTAANTLATAHASASGDMQGVPARTASPAFQNLPTSEVINIFRMTNAERDEAFKRVSLPLWHGRAICSSRFSGGPQWMQARLTIQDPVLQNRYNLTLHKVLATTRKQQNPGTAAAISAAIAALTPGSSSGSVGAASTGTSSPHIPGAGSATGTDDTGQGSTAASITAENVLPDASNFNLSLPPSVKAKKGLSNASNPSKAEDSSTLDGHSGNDETVKLEETDMDLDSRFGADPSVDMGRSTDMEAASGSGSSHGHALAAGRGKGSGNGVGSGPVELPSPFNLSSGSGGGSSSTNAAGASGSGPYAQLNYSARGQAGQDTYPGNRSGLPEGARSVGWERSTGTMGLQQGKQAAAPIQPSLRPQPLPLEPESARRKRKVREMLREVAPGMEMEVGVDEVSFPLLWLGYQIEMPGNGANHAASTVSKARDR